jgi:hypothetical protein
MARSSITNRVLLPIWNLTSLAFTVCIPVAILVSWASTRISLSSAYSVLGFLEPASPNSSKFLLQTSSKGLRTTWSVLVTATTLLSWYQFSVFVTLHCCDQTPDINNLRGRKTYFGSRFQRLQFIMPGRAAHIMVARKQRWRQGGAMDKVTPKDLSPVTHFLQLGPTY